MNFIDNYETYTSYLIHKSYFTKDSLNNLKSKLSTVDYKTKEEIPTAIFEKDDYVIFPKIDINIINYILGKPILFKKVYIEDIPTRGRLFLKWKPLPHQERVIHDGIKHLQESSDKRLCICLAPGLGKTFCASAVITKLQTKFLFLVYSDRIIDQSIAAMKEHTGGSGFYKLTKSSDFTTLRNEKIDGLFMTHAMFKTIVKNIGVEETSDILFNKMKLTTKVLDEFDRATGSMYTLDSMFAFKYSVYLTGTKFRSLKPDDRLFQLIFKKVKTVGHDIILPPNKDVIFVNYMFSPTKTEFAKMNRDSGMFKIHFNNHLANKDVLVDYIMRRFYYDKDKSKEENEKKLFPLMLKEEGQIQFFVSRIENCDRFKKKLIERYGINENDIGIINSSKSDREKKLSIDKPFLISTSGSLGRGVDSDKVRVLVLLEFHFSLPEHLQIINRVGRVNKPKGYYIFPVDSSFLKSKKTFESQNGFGLFDNVERRLTCTIPKEEYVNYINGYALDSPEGIELLKKGARAKANDIVNTVKNIIEGL